MVPENVPARHPHFDEAPRAAMLRGAGRSLRTTLAYWLAGRLHFKRDRIGQPIPADDGHTYTIFREVVVDPQGGQPAAPGATFLLRFRVTNLTPRQNQLLSLLPLPLYIGYPGFRRKLFTIDGADCQSIYEWDTLQQAEDYGHSVAIRSIVWRAAPGTVTYRVVPGRLI